ncbi:MAG: bifunctional 4-hydroxy-2-oxoglutarate aldolase/2-dehydro-3-deoxy-phosphogluconate aldolase [Thermoguttaceae bacterium]
MHVFEKIAEYKVVPVIAIESEESALPLADALIAGGLPIAEITFRTAAAAKVIKLLTEKRPEMLIGAGTLLTEDNVKAALDAGAKFGVAPGLNLDTLDSANEIGLPFIPGACTPSEVEAALASECKVIKFFPAGAIGGVKMLKALIGPYAHTGVKFMPTGGITVENLKEYLAEKSVIACGGTWIATKEDIALSRWSLIQDRCEMIKEIDVRR